MESSKLKSSQPHIGVDYDLGIDFVCVLIGRLLIPSKGTRNGWLFIKGPANHNQMSWEASLLS